MGWHLSQYAESNERGPRRRRSRLGAAVDPTDARKLDNPLAEIWRGIG
jgi:hypothetical protein